MSTPAQTPGPRRFLSHSKPFQPKTQLLSTARKPHFVRPSQLTSSSPFLTTPHTQQHRPSDEIDLEYNEDEEEASPIPAQSHRSRPPRIQFHDSIEDTEDQAFTTGRKPVTIPNHDNIEQQFTSSEHIYDVISKEDSSSPLPKRQKRDHKRSTRLGGNPVRTASSPSSCEEEDNDVERGDCDIDMGANNDQDEDILSSVETGLPNKSKFKMPTPAQFPSQFLSPDTHTKLGFRPFLQHNAGPGSTFADLPLPEAFSPSRRKGTKGYLYGGMAETVRNWVLEIANEEFLSSDKSTHEALQIASLSKDPSNRFEIVQDQEEKKWMMIHQQGRSTSFPHIDSGNSTKVKVRGKSTKWVIDLDDELYVNVTVLWDEMG